jgi:CBS domain-containing protein
MKRNVLTTTPDRTLEQAAQNMVERSVGAAVIVKDQAVVGIVTERDVMRAVALGMVPWSTKLEDIMTRDPICTKPSMDIHEAIAMMLEGKFRHLPVVDDDGKLIGIVSTRDLLRAAEEPSGSVHAPTP